MAEYIERKTLLERAEYDNNYRLIIPAEAIKDAPAADVMEVTRCKDCEHSFKDPVGLCCSYGACKDCLVPEYYFCFHGEPRRNG